MMFHNALFAKDVYRYYGTERETLKQRLLRPLELRYIYCLRRCNQQDLPAFLRLWYKVRLRLLSHKTHIQIGTTAKIGEGFYIGHYGRLSINYQAVLGKKCKCGSRCDHWRNFCRAQKGCPHHWG